MHYSTSPLSLLLLQVRLVCGGLGGLHGGLATLVQLAATCGREGKGVPALVIRDHPSVAQRGLMLDVAPHARVPTLVR